jgi:hypothetical protein
LNERAPQGRDFKGRRQKNAGIRGGTRLTRRLPWSAGDAFGSPAAIEVVGRISGA